MALCEELTLPRHTFLGPPEVSFQRANWVAHPLFNSLEVSVLVGRGRAGVSLCGTGAAYSSFQADH